MTEFVNKFDTVKIITNLKDNSVNQFVDEIKAITSNATLVDVSQIKTCKLLIILYSFCCLIIKKDYIIKSNESLYLEIEMFIEFV